MQPNDQSLRIRYDVPSLCYIVAKANILVSFDMGASWRLSHVSFAWSGQAVLNCPSMQEPRRPSEYILVVVSLENRYGRDPFRVQRIRAVPSAASVSF